jgi:hypothetical protein
LPSKKHKRAQSKPVRQTQQDEPPIVPAGKLIDAGSIRLDAKLDEAEARAAEVAYLKPFMQAEIKAAIKRGQQAKKLQGYLPPNPRGRPKKYPAIIAEAAQKIESGALVLPTSKDLTKFVQGLTTSPAARKTIRNNLQPIWSAALKKRLPEIR